MSLKPINFSSAKSTARSADSVQRDLKIVKRVKSAVDKKMSYLMDGLAANVANALFEEMYGMDEKESLSQHFNITRSLKTAYGPYLEEYGLLINLSWVNLIKKKDVPSVVEPSAKVKNLLKGYSNRNLNLYKLLLDELRLRFSQLANMELTYHPLLPSNFYLCFWHSTEKLGLDFEERKLVLPLFNRFVMDRFGQVLYAANQSLIEQGIDQFQKPQ